MIPDAQVEEVRARADLVDVIGELVPLKKSGKEFKANCPFHDERTPSFYVVPAKGFYKCFGCGESGDVFSFVMKRLGLDFVDAVKHVAARSGVEIHEVSRGGEAQEDPFRAHYEANAFARDFFRRMLLDGEIGRDARDYLAHRGIDEATAERFGLGYAPDEWRALRDAAGKHDMPDALLVEVGLLTTSERAPEPYDRFRHRIMFPIEDAGGRVVAFGGRILGSGASRSTGKEPAKYVNTSETPIYHKGQVLYGLAWAKNAIRREGAALVVEGYMDTVSLAAAGFENVVAPLGTSFTDDQAQLLARYTKRVLLLFDSDQAGLKATFRCGDVLLAHALHPAVVTLPTGEDPDTLVRKEGAAGLRHYLDQAVDLLDRKIQMLQEHDFFGSIDGTRRALDKLLPTVRATVDPTLRDLYVSRVAERTGVRRETLEGELGRSLAPPRRPDRGPEIRPAARRRPKATSPILDMGPERYLVACLVQMPDWVPEAAERLGPTVFRDEVNRAIFERLLIDPTLTDADGLAPPVLERLAMLKDPARVLVATRNLFESSMSELLQELTQEQRLELTRRLHESGSVDEQRSIERQLRTLQGAGPDRPRGSDARKVYTLANPITKTTG